MFMFRKTHDALLKGVVQEARAMGALAAKYKRERNDAEVALSIARAEAEANKADAEELTEKGKDEGATYVLSSLASALHVEDWSIQNGSEEWEGDVWATMFRILVDAGVVEEDYHQVATFTEIAATRAERDDLLVDAEKYRRSRANLTKGTAASAAARRAKAQQQAA